MLQEEGPLTKRAAPEGGGFNDAWSEGFLEVGAADCVGDARSAGPGDRNDVARAGRVQLKASQARPLPDLCQPPFLSGSPCRCEQTMLFLGFLTSMGACNEMPHDKLSDTGLQTWLLQ
jgi:hypothetical protein